MTPPPRSSSGSSASTSPTAPPRGALFAHPAAKVVWAGFLALEEHHKHLFLTAVQEQDAFERLRREHPHLGWPPEASVRRWLAGADGDGMSWSVALGRAGLETLAQEEVLVARLGSPFTVDEVVAAVGEFVDEHQYLPGMRELFRWARRPDVRDRPGRRPQSQPVIDRLFPGGWEDVIRAATGAADGEDLPLTYNQGAARPAGRSWSDEARVRALRQCAARYERSPRTTEYMAWRSELNATRAESGLPPLALPSYTSFNKRYGSWDAALVAAGLEALGGSATCSNPGRRGPKPGPRVPDEQLLDLLRAAFDAKGHPFTTQAYLDWVAEQKAADREAGRHRRYSTYGTVITRFGRWARACELALPGEFGQ